MTKHSIFAQAIDDKKGDPYGDGFAENEGYRESLAHVNNGSGEETTSKASQKIADEILGMVIKEGVMYSVIFCYWLGRGFGNTY